MGGCVSCCLMRLSSACVKCLPVTAIVVYNDTGGEVVWGRGYKGGSDTQRPDLCTGNVVY